MVVVIGSDVVETKSFGTGGGSGRGVTEIVGRGVIPIIEGIDILDTLRTVVVVVNTVVASSQTALANVPLSFVSDRIVKHMG